jgi:predicted DNA-binding mobile mystery protein A
MGMSSEAFAKRLDISRQAVHQLERAEGSESITVKRLRRAADALGCDLLVTVVPRQPLEVTVQERARAVAEERLQAVNRSMALENQYVQPKRLQQMVREAAADLIARGDSALWE